MKGGAGTRKAAASAESLTESAGAPSRPIRFAHGAWWWRTWLLGCVGSWVGWIIHMAMVIGLRDHEEPEHAMHSVEFALSASAPILACMVVPGVYVAIGAAQAGRWMSHMLRHGATPRTQANPPMLLAAQMFVALLVFAAAGSDVEDMAGSVIIHALAGQMTFGLYLPFALCVAAPYCHTKSKSVVARAVWSVIGASSWFTGLWFTDWLASDG